LTVIQGKNEKKRVIANNAMTLFFSFSAVFVN